MNDRQAAPTSAFDPAGAGWEKVPTVGFGEFTGPLWKRGIGAELRFGFVVAEHHLNRGGILHGGMLMTLADQAMAMTAREVTHAKRHATIELNIQFVGSVRLGEFVEAHAEVVRATRSVVFMRAKMFVGPRTVVSTNGIWKILEEGDPSV